MGVTRLVNSDQSRWAKDRLNESVLHRRICPAFGVRRSRLLVVTFAIARIDEMGELSPHAALEVSTKVAHVTASTTYLWEALLCISRPGSVTLLRSLSATLSTAKGLL
jgi:hypothetical protein